MYALHKYNEWPHRILIKFNDETIASTDRYVSSTRFRTSDDADMEYENTTQLAKLVKLIERANAGLEQEQNNASIT